MNEALIQACLSRREQDDRAASEWLREKPRFAMLSSPEALKSAYELGQDSTDTIGDCAKVLQWVAEAELFNTGFYKEARETAEAGEQLEQVVYKAVVLSAFKLAFDPIRNTASLTDEELVFWYYAGHGLDSGHAGRLNQNCCNPSPTAVPIFQTDQFSAGRLNQTNCNCCNPPSTAVPISQTGQFNARDYFSSAQEFLPPDQYSRKLKGGELYLHDFGFCGLYGLLEAWIAALKTPSQHAHNPSSETKENKHLVIVLDSCYSGQFAVDLEKLALKLGPWNENNCAVTIQASCSANETADGGYFTPCFTHLNRNKPVLENLENSWNEMDEDTKQKYRSLQFQSPEVATTHSDGNAGPVLSIQPQQNFEMVLFPDAGFFKYCSVMLFEADEKAFLDSRQLTDDPGNQFLSQPSFTILDYKLMISPDANTYMGLFLVETQPGDQHVVCVHIHFALNNTSSPLSVTFLNHLRPTHSNILYVEEPSRQRIPVDNVDDAETLVQACHTEVEADEAGRWDDTSRWDMTKGAKELFRVKQRSAEMDGYVNHYLWEATNTSCCSCCNCPQCCTTM